MVSVAAGMLLLTSCGSGADPEEFEVAAADMMAQGAWSDFSAAALCSSERAAFGELVASDAPAEVVRLELGPEREDGTHELSLVAGDSALPFPAVVRAETSEHEDGYCIDFGLG